MHRFPSRRETTFERPFYDPRHPARHPSQSAVKRRTPKGQHYDQDSKPLDEFRSAGLCTAFPRGGEPRSNVHSTILVTQRATRAKAPSNGALQMGNTAICVSYTISNENDHYSNTHL
jgi:hypothetical protein